MNKFSPCHKINSGLDLEFIVFGNRKIPVFTVWFKGYWAERSRDSGWEKSHELLDSSFCAANVIICVKQQHYKERHLEKIRTFTFNKIKNWDPVQFDPFCHPNVSVCSFCKEWENLKIAYCYQPNTVCIISRETHVSPRSLRVYR